MELSKHEKAALRLLSRGFARYGTRIEDMKSLQAKGLCYAYDKGEQKKVGRWQWRPTAFGRQIIAEVCGDES